MMFFALLGNNVQIQACLDVYRNAIHTLEDILRTNDTLRKVIEEYICLHFGIKLRE